MQAHSARFNALADADAGTNGIPPALAQTAITHGMNVVDGMITITWRADGSLLAGTTYSLAAQSVTPPIEWVHSGSCQAAGYSQAAFPQAAPDRSIVAAVAASAIAARRGEPRGPCLALNSAATQIANI